MPSLPPLQPSSHDSSFQFQAPSAAVKRVAASNDHGNNRSDGGKQAASDLVPDADPSRIGSRSNPGLVRAKSDHGMSIGRTIKKRPVVQGGRNWQLIDFLLSKVLRFSRPFTQRRMGNQGESQRVAVDLKMTPIEELKVECTQMLPEREAIKYSWRDPSANYLSPAAYSPCRARLILWGSGVNKYICARHPEEAPKLDEITLRRLEFLRCFVRVNNLPERCGPEQLVRLFNELGALRMWHVDVAPHHSGAWVISSSCIGRMRRRPSIC